LSYAGFCTRRTDGGAQGRIRYQPRDRVAIRRKDRPDCLVLLYACARLGAMLVPLNWRLAVAEQLFICRTPG
jgi:fatty-acyl-CoA synthase